jgi:hypothetical protein
MVACLLSNKRLKKVAEYFGTVGAIAVRHLLYRLQIFALVTVRVAVVFLAIRLNKEQPRIAKAIKHESGERGQQQNIDALIKLITGMNTTALVE